MHPSEKIRSSNLFVHTSSGESDPVGESQHIIEKNDLILGSLDPSGPLLVESWIPQRALSC
jgi:hypothetical protein